MACQIGISVKDFWDLTPREFECECQAHKNKEKNDLTKSFYNAIMSSSSKPEELYKVIWDKLDGNEHEQTSEEHIKIALQYATYSEGQISVNFKLGLDVIPDFNPCEYNYILKTKQEKIKFLPSVLFEQVCIYGDPEYPNGYVVIPENGIYEIKIVNNIVIKIN